MLPSRKVSQTKLLLPVSMEHLLKPMRMVKKKTRILKRMSLSLTITGPLPSRTLSVKKDVSVPIFMTILC